MLEALRDALERDASAALTQSHAISGLGGVGKTQIAIEYAYRFRDQYSAVLWVRGPSREDLLAAYGDLVHLLKLSAGERSAIEAVVAWMKAHASWLLIVDNADDLRVTEEFIPQGHRGHVLLTTRAPATGHIAQGIPVSSLDNAAGALLLLRRAKLLRPGESIDNAKAVDRVSAERLSEELGGLPLALDQAGAFIEEVPSTLDEYHALYRQEGERLRAERGSSDFGHASVAVTFSLASKQLKENTPASNIVALSAFCASHQIPEMIFRSHFDNNTVTFLTTFDYLKALQEAARFSLVTRDTNTSSLTFHRLVQQVTQDELGQDLQQQYVASLARAIERCYPSDEFSDWKLCERLDAHARECLAHHDRLGLALPDAALLLKHLRVVLLEHFRPAEARDFATRSVALAERSNAPGPLLADCLHTLGRIELNQMKTDEALALHERAWELNRGSLPKDHRSIAISLNNLALVYRTQCRFAKSEKLYKESIRILRGNGAAGRHLLARALHNLGGLYIDGGKPREVAKALSAALEVKRSLQGEHNIEISISYFMLSFALMMNSKPRAAEEAIRAAIHEVELSSEPEHPHLYYVLKGYAQFLRQSKRTEEAKKVEERMHALKAKGAYRPKPSSAF